MSTRFINEKLSEPIIIAKTCMLGGLALSWLFLTMVWEFYNVQSSKSQSK